MPDTENISQTTYRPWETKTIDKFTPAELVHWVNWYTTGRAGPVVFDAELVVHNILLWERTRVENAGKLDPVVESIFGALSEFAPGGEISDETDAALVRKTIAELIEKTWLPREIINYLRWMEHVNQYIEEDYALRKMATVRQAVEHRLSQNGRPTGSIPA